MKYILFIALLFSYSQSAPAFSKSKVLQQENGVTFIGHPRGDEHLHWIQSDDGEILKYNPASKNYELAEIKDNSLKPSGRKYVSGLKKARTLNSTNLKDEDVLQLWKLKKEAHRLRMHPAKSKH